MRALIFAITACALLAAGCDSDTEPSNGLDAAVDSGTPSNPADGGMDASHEDAALDAGDDAARDGAIPLDGAPEDAEVPVCEVAACPALDASIVVRGDPDSPTPCCVSSFDEMFPAELKVGQCGQRFWVSVYADSLCSPIVDGVVDDTCLDTMVEGEVLQGCRRPDGYCGHLEEPFGCHFLHRQHWARNIEADDPPNPFVCTEGWEPCTEDYECCDDGNGSVCWDDESTDVVDKHCEPAHEHI